MTNYISDSFTGSNGSAWNSSNWTIVNGTQTIQGNRGQMVTPGSYGQSIIDAAVSIPSDFAITGQYQYTATSNYLLIEYRNASYQMGIDLCNGQLLWYENGSLVGYQGGQTTSSSDVINFRLEVSGTSHKFRYWLNAASEPTSWNFNLTGTYDTTSSGLVRLIFSDANVGTGYVDNVSIDSVAASTDKTVSAGVFLGATTRSQPTLTTAVATVASVGVASASTVRPEPSAATRAQVGAATRSQPTITVSAGAVANAGVVTTTQLGASSDVTTTSRMIVGVVANSTVRPEPSVATRAQVGAATTSQAITSVSVSTVAGVGVVTTSAVSASGDVTVTSGMVVGVATVSTVRPEPSALTRTQVGVTTSSQPTISISVSTVAGVGVATTAQLGVSGDVTTTSGMIVGAATRSQPTVTVSITTVAGVGVTASSQPTISATVATLAIAGALLQSGAARIELSTTSRGVVGVATISTLGGEIVVSFGPLIGFREPKAVYYVEPAIISFREPRTVTS